MAMARIGISALESWWRTTKLAPESSRPSGSKLARSLLAIRLGRLSSREIGDAFRAPRAPIERPEPASSRFSFCRRRERP